MDNWQYLIVLGLCILITLPLEFGFGARVYRNPRQLVLAMAPMLVIFIAWDSFAILRGPSATRRHGARRLLSLVGHRARTRLTAGIQGAPGRPCWRHHRQPQTPCTVAT